MMKMDKKQDTIWRKMMARILLNSALILSILCWMGSIT